MTLSPRARRLQGCRKCTIEAGGIGYELAMSVHALATLPACGNPAQVWTYLHVKEDDVSLFGFSEPAERELFEKLIAVSGIGPKMAISALSTFKPADFVAHIAAGDVTAISTIPGVGKKIAQRMFSNFRGFSKQVVPSRPSRLTRQTAPCKMPPQHLSPWASATKK